MKKILVRIVFNPDHLPKPEKFRAHTRIGTSLDPTGLGRHLWWEDSHSAKRGVVSGGEARKLFESSVRPRRIKQRRPTSVSTDKPTDNFFNEVKMVWSIMCG